MSLDQPVQPSGVLDFTFLPCKRLPFGIFLGKCVLCRTRRDFHSRLGSRNWTRARLIAQRLIFTCGSRISDLGSRRLRG